MAKLFSKEEHRNDVYLNPLETHQIDLQSISLTEMIQSDSDTLFACSRAYSKVLKLSNNIASENYSLITQKNYEFYNDYLKSIAENTGVSIPLVRKEAFENLNEVFINRSLALEGFISAIWEKIKHVFTVIADKVKEFFKKYFTRMGRLKNRIANVIKVIEGTNKDLDTLTIDKNISKIAKVFPEDEITLNVLKSYIQNTKAYLDSMNAIQQSITDIVKSDIIPDEYIEELRGLIENQKAIDAEKSTTEKPMSTADKAALDKIPSDKEVEEKEETKEEDIQVGSAIKNKTDEKEPTEEDDKLYISKHVNSFNKAVGDIVKEITNKKIATGVTAELETNRDIYSIKFTSPVKTKYRSLALGTKQELLDMLGVMQSFIEENDKYSKAYINNLAEFDKSIQKIGRTIVTIDRLEAGNKDLSKHKRFASNVVRPSLIKFKEIFVQYNKIFNHVFEVNATLADGVVEYSVVSLKHFN